MDSSSIIAENKEECSKNLLTCNFCDKLFTTKYILLKHQKTTKKCLLIQNGINETPLKNENIYQCEYCNYSTSRKENLHKHKLSCYEKHKKVIENYDKKYNDMISEKDNIINELKIIIENQKIKIKLESVTAKFEQQSSTVLDLQKMVMKSRSTTNNNYITNKQKIEYSKANLQPYDELKDNIDNIIASKFNKTTFQSIENVATFITNDLLNYNKKEYYHCFDTKGSIFHKKNKNDEIDVDEKAENLLNDILPSIVERSRAIYIQESDEYNDKNTENKEDEKALLSISKALKNVRNISKRGSDERNLCIRRIANCYCISSNQIKSQLPLLSE